MFLNPYPHLGSAIEGEIGIWPKDSHRRFVLRLTSSILQKYLELTPPSAIKVVLSQCFVPSELGKRWLDAHGLKAPDYWFRGSAHSKPSPRRKHIGKQEKLTMAFIALHKEGDDICSPASVQELHTRALQKAEIGHSGVNNRTIERARTAALKRID